MTKRYKTLLILLNFSFFFASSVTAEDNVVPQEAIVQAQSYVGSISCYTASDEFDETSLPPLAIVLEGEAQDGGEFPEAEYLVFVPGDPGCGGGSGTSTFVAVSVKKGPLSSAFYADPLNSEPAITLSDVNLRTLNSVRALDNGNILVTWAEWGEGDANCCPSILVETILSKDEYGNWSPFDG